MRDLHETAAAWAGGAVTGWVVRDTDGPPQVVLVATGSEVWKALEAAEALPDGRIVGLSRLEASAPGDEVLQRLGFTRRRSRRPRGTSWRPAAAHRRSRRCPSTMVPLDVDTLAMHLLHGTQQAALACRDRIGRGVRRVAVPPRLVVEAVHPDGTTGGSHDA